MLICPHCDITFIPTIRTGSGCTTKQKYCTLRCGTNARALRTYYKKQGQNPSYQKRRVGYDLERLKSNRNTQTAKRKVKKTQAVVVWANDFLIQEYYHLARLRTQTTGIPWEVDHVIPLSNENVSGLHVETNLQVIPRSVNRKKGNALCTDY